MLVKIIDFRSFRKILKRKLIILNNKFSYHVRQEGNKERRRIRWADVINRDSKLHNKYEKSDSVAQNHLEK